MHLYLIIMHLYSFSVLHMELAYSLLNYCRQICLGMQYLSGKGFVHKSLAARNVLVSSGNICKVNYR